MVYYKVKGTEVIDTPTKNVVKQTPIKEIEKASEKQLWLLNKLGYKGTLDLTMSDAHALIKKFKQK